MAEKFINSTPVAQPADPLKPQEKTGFYNVPDSPASNLVMETLGAGADIGDLPDRKRQVNHSQTLEVLENGKSRRVMLTSGKAQVTLELADIDKLTGSNKPAKKLFVLTLLKANEQAIFDGQLARDYVSFPLQELIDTGFYSTPQSARKGFNSGMDALTSLKVKGHIQQSKKKETTIDALEVLFTGARIERGQCTVFLNPRINWSFIAQYFTILPRYYFALPNRASDLLYYIFYLARQHTKDIEERGYFTIGFRAIQHRLQLPSEIGNTRPQQTIKQPIEDAIEELETAHSNLYGNTEFCLLPVYDEAASIADYLDNGYLQVTLKGEFAKAFIEISKDTAKQIETARKRKERITEKAIAIKQADKMKKEESGKQ
jgi:hypothetical protein